MSQLTMSLLMKEMRNLCRYMPSRNLPSNDGIERQDGIHEGILDSRV